MDIQKNNGSKCLLSHEPDKQVNGEGKSSSRSSSSSSSGSSCIKLKDIGSSGDGKTLKIRKPYTITKQREKWTEEEHNKFIEALQFYGRDWRRIEEYVGTKTAVQIRSHAQKFFSKVAQEAASNGSSGTSKPFEIPPPRPKRKPAHPYPRKLGSSSSQTSRILPQLGVYSLQIHKVPEKDGRSPTSVLYSSGSDKSSGGSSNHQGNEVQGGSRTTPGSANAKLTKGDKHMDLDGLPGGKVTSEEDSLAEVAAIKLFGKVVLADHSAKVCPSEASSMAPEIKPSCPVDPDAQHAHPNDACNCLDCPRQHHHEIAIICGDDEDAGVYILDELNKSLISGNLHG